MADYPAKPPQKLHRLLPAPSRLSFLPARRKNWAPGTLKVFASPETVADDQRNYRQIFDESELSYVFAEFTFYNRLAGIRAWRFECVLKCFDYYGNEVCTQPVQIDVPPSQNVVYMREGWGKPEAGEFWKMGTYTWAVYIDNELVASTKFYVNNLGPLAPGNGAEPYFVVEHVKLFEAPAEPPKPASRQYATVFNAESVRYIWVEFQAANRMQAYPQGWAAELFFRFYVGNGIPKATLHTFTNQPPGATNLSTEMGWGHASGKAWLPGPHRLDVLFMNRVVASVPFEIV